MAKCNACRSGDTLPLAGDNWCCLGCGHTGPAAPSTPPELEVVEPESDGGDE